MYEVIISLRALKKISKLNKEDQTRIYKVLERVKIRPEAHLKKLTGFSTYRLSTGKYRLIVDLDQNKLRILVLNVGLRKNIYKK